MRKLPSLLMFGGYLINCNQVKTDQKMFHIRNEREVTEMIIPKNPRYQFEALFGKDFPGKIAIWTKQDKQTAFFTSKDIDKAESYCLRRAATQDVYYGVGLVREKLEGGRGKEEDIIALPGFWLDVDFGEDGHKATKYPPSLQEACRVVQQFPLRHSLMISSGYGLHVYFLFDQLLQLNTSEDRAKAKALSSGFQKKFNELFAAEGYKLDNTSDLSRVLRVAGTKNHKNGSKKDVKVIFINTKEEGK